MAGKSANEPTTTTTHLTSMEVVGDREIVIRRTFNAVPRLVFDAFTKAELVAQWWAPRSHDVTLIACDADVVVGGKYRYVMQKNDGGEPFAFSGVYRALERPARLVYSQVFEPMADAGEAIITVTFEPWGSAQTRMVSRELYPAPQVRDGVIASGMEHGMREAMDQLDTLVASL